MIRSKGLRRFEDCQVKQVEFVRAGESQKKAMLIVGAILHCPRTEDDDLSVDVNASHVSTDYSTRHKFVDGDNKETVVAYDNPQVANRHLGRSAGRMACRICPYAKMSPVEAAEHRAERAEIKRDVALLDQRRLEAELTHRQALVEIAHLQDQIREIHGPTE